MEDLTRWLVDGEYDRLPRVLSKLLQHFYEAERRGGVKTGGGFLQRVVSSMTALYQSLISIYLALYQSFISIYKALVSPANTYGSGHTVSSIWLYRVLC